MSWSHANIHGCWLKSLVGAVLWVGRFVLKICQGGISELMHSWKHHELNQSISTCKGAWNECKDKNEQPQQKPGNPNFTKVDGCLVDNFGVIPITLWNDHVSLDKSGEYYEFQNMGLGKYSGNIYLSSNTATKIKQVSIDTVVPKSTQTAEQLKI